MASLDSCVLNFSGFFPQISFLRYHWHIWLKCIFIVMIEELKPKLSQSEPDTQTFPAKKILL